MRSLWVQLVVLGLFLALAQCSGQGTLTPITFDGPPVQAPGTARLVGSYDESGVWFAPIPGSMYGFGRRGSQPTLGWPDDGTAYVQAGSESTLMFGMDDGSSFDPISVDLAEYSDVLLQALGPATVHFVGYRQDGSVLTDDITTAGIFNGVAPVFQTFSFDPAFNGLTRVEIPYPLWSLDNLTIQRSVPELATGALMCVGGVLVGLRLLKPNKITRANAGGPRQLPMRTRWAAGIAQFRRWAPDGREPRIEL